MDIEQIQDESLHFIQRLDAAAFEMFTRGDTTAERYREMALEIRNIQRQTVDMLFGINMLNIAARE